MPHREVTTAAAQLKDRAELGPVGIDGAGRRFLDRFWLVAVWALILAPATTHALIVPLHATLGRSRASGAGETSSTGRWGHGFAPMGSGHQAELASWKVSWSDLSSAPVTGSLDFRRPATPFEHDGTPIASENPASHSSVDLRYSGIDTAALSGGEICSQPVPEPTPTLLLSLGLLGLAVSGLRRPGI